MGAWLRHFLSADVLISFQTTNSVGQSLMSIASTVDLAGFQFNIISATDGSPTSLDIVPQEIVTEAVRLTLASALHVPRKSYCLVVHDCAQAFTVLGDVDSNGDATVFGISLGGTTVDSTDSVATPFLFFTLGSFGAGVQPLSTQAEFVAGDGGSASVVDCGFPPAPDECGTTE